MGHSFRNLDYFGDISAWFKTVLSMVWMNKGKEISPFTQGEWPKKSFSAQYWYIFTQKGNEKK